MLLDDPQLDRLEAEVLSLLDNVGLRVAHDEVAALLEKRGCRPGPKGRLRIPREVLCEVIESQQARAAAIEKPATDPPPTTPQQAPDEPLPPTPKRFPGFATPQASDGPALLEAAFCPGPIRYYDLERRAAVDLTDAIADDMMRLAEATPEVASVHCWWRRNAEPEVECIANLVLALKLTRKATGLDAIHPAQVKYLVQIGEVLTGDPRSTRYLWGSQCMTPPLILGDRAAEEMLERQRQGVPVYFVATMPMIGVSSPVTRLGSVVMGAAEILGGMTAAHAIAPEGEITGGAFVVCADRTGGQMTTAAPQMAWVNAAIRELFDRRFGGRVITGTKYSPCAKAPGLQATYENYFLAAAAARLEGGPVRYWGNGLIANGAVGSPEQLMLDIEALSALAEIERPVPDIEESLALEAIHDAIQGESGSFLDHEHTLRHWRRRWTPQLFRWESPESAAQDDAEPSILQRAHQQWRENLSRYEPPDWPDDTLAALDRVEAEARRELLGA